jgi:hypothetical protein
MDFFHEQPLLVFQAVQPAALDLAARVGLSAPELSWPVAAPYGGDLPPGRALLLIGTGNARLPAGLSLSPLAPGCGALSRIDARTVLLRGADAAGEALACLWAAACWDGRLNGERLVTPADLDNMPPDEAAPPPPAWPPRGGYRCLSRTFSPEGLLASRDGAFPDDTSVRFDLAPGLTNEEFAAVLDLAARIGAESTGVTFPLAKSGGPVIRVGRDAGDGWVKLTDGGLSIAAGPSLKNTLTYLARTFPSLPGGQGWPERDLLAVKDILGHRDPGQPEVILDETWQDDGEPARLRAAWQGDLLPRIIAAGPAAGWQVTVTLSEPREIREALAAELTAALAAAGCPCARVVVRPAYKQGYYWLVDETLPALESLRPDRLVLGWRPFAEPGVRDLPIRWLQEVYPADEVLAARLGAAVELAELPAAGPAALEIRAFRGGAEVFAAAMTPASRRRPYLDNDPAEGLACHPAGWIEARHPAKGPVISQHFATDLELFWQWYSAGVLTRIEAMTGADEPLFGTLAVEYAGSEPDEPLGVGEETAAPLEALHEDLYFTTLDRFASLGKARRGEPYNAPGAILPWLRSVPGWPPRARVTLTRPVRREAIDIPVTGLHLDGRIVADGQVVVPPPLEIPAGEETPGPVDLATLVARLGELAAAGVRVRIAARSTGGLPVFAVELPARAGTFGAGAALRHPTLLINARHHANEVASTTAALALAKRLAADPALRGRVNIVVVPLENVDGAQIHDLMQRDNPRWKHHAARYNRDGCEYYGEYFNPATPYGEARALSRLWRQWLPDVVLDAHGVPSHEWIQCFSGYGSPPRFKMSIWLPNALIYGILYQPLAHAGNIAAGEDLARAMAAAFAADGEIDGLNKRWLARYRRWGSGILPDKFPVELMGDAIFYRHDAAERQISFTWWRPDVTAVHCVSEVADETAQGGYLDLCARAQGVAMQAAIGWLAAAPAGIEEGVGRTAAGLVRRWRRRRRIQETTAGEGSR